MMFRSIASLLVWGFFFSNHAQALVSPALISAVRAAECEKLLVSGTFTPTGQFRPVQRYFQGKRSHPLTFGIEVEYAINENPALLDDYRLVTVSPQAWAALSRAERIEKVTAFMATVPPLQKPVALVKLPGVLPDLPGEIFHEGNGNLEMRGDQLVFATWEEASIVTAYLSYRYGAGSMQGHVAYGYHDVQLQGAAGFVVFDSDWAQLETLEYNHERYLQDQTSIPGKNLVHHSLRPIAEMDRLLYLDFEAAANRGEAIGRPGASRTIYGPSFRGDIYPPGIAGFELRQYHKRWVLQGVQHASF